MPLPEAPPPDDPLFADELLPNPAPLPIEVPALLRDELALERLPADAVFVPERLVVAEPVEPDSYRDEMPSAAIVDESSRPVVCRLFALWNLRRAASVCGPITPSADPALNPLSFSACCTDRMNAGSFVFAIPLDDPLIELMLEDGMLEPELPDAFDAVFEALPYVEDDEPIAVLEPDPLPYVDGDDDAVVPEPLPYVDGDDDAVVPELLP